MLYDDLTTREHLLFYARLKGYPIRKEMQHVEAIIKEVSLQNERRRLARDLSGGQKRRLSFAIALTSDPAVVFLDEPTSGLDPGCTREMWTVITEARVRNHEIIMMTCPAPSVFLVNHSLHGRS